MVILTNKEQEGIESFLDTATMKDLEESKVFMNPWGKRLVSAEIRKRAKQKRGRLF